MKRQQLQSALKNFRNQGIVVNCKLNATNVILQAEYNRIIAAQVVAPAIEAPAPIDELEQLRKQLDIALAKVAGHEQTIAIQESTIATMQETIDTMSRLLNDFKGETVVDDAVVDAIEITAVTVDEPAQQFAEAFVSDNRDQMAIAYYRMSDTYAPAVDELNRLCVEWKQEFKTQVSAKVISILQKHNVSTEHISQAIGTESVAKVDDEFEADVEVADEVVVAANNNSKFDRRKAIQQHLGLREYADVAKDGAKVGMEYAVVELEDGEITLDEYRSRLEYVKRDLTEAEYNRYKR